MKKTVFLCSLLFAAAALFAGDGVQFNQSGWKEILAQAKKENKLVFVDVYTSWCGPCKKMSAEVFPQKKVGDVFNPSFVNCQIDAEKGEGIEIAKQFGVRSYPTYLFVNGEGQLVYRTGGYMSAEAFLKEGNIALKEKEDPKPYAKWEAEYANGRRDKSFLMDYLKKRSMLKIPSAEIIEELFPLLTAEELKDKSILSTILFYDATNEYVPGGQAFSYVIDNYKMLDSLQLVKYPLGIMEIGINNYFNKNIIPNKKEEMLPVMTEAYGQLLDLNKSAPAEKIVTQKSLPVKYYAGTNETKLNAAVVDFVQNGIMKLDIAAKQKADEESYSKFMEPYLSGKADSTKTENYSLMKRVKKNSQMVNVSYKLRDAAEAVYKTTENRKMLLQATTWAKQANEWFPHFSSEAVYAALLFKTGKKQEAIAAMEVASKDVYLTGAAEVQKLIMANIEKMKKGVMPKELWHL